MSEQDASELVEQIVGGVLSIIGTIVVVKVLGKFVINPMIDKKLEEIRAREATAPTE